MFSQLVLVFFGKNRASLKIECNNISVKRHLLEQVKIKKPRGIYVVEYLSPDKRKIYNSLFNLKKRYPSVIKFVYIRGGVIFGKIGEGTLKFESMLDVQAINLQRSPAAVPAAAAAVPPPPRVLGTVAASGLAVPRAAAVAASPRPDPADAAASPPSPAAADPLLDPVTAAAAPHPSCLVGPIAAFDLTAPAPAAVAAPPLPPPLVLVDAAAAAAPSRWVDPVAAFGLTAPAAAAAPPPPPPLSDPAAAVPPPLLGPAVDPSPLSLLLTDGVPESSDWCL